MISQICYIVALLICSSASIFFTFVLKRNITVMKLLEMHNYNLYKELQIQLDSTRIYDAERKIERIAQHLNIKV